MINIEKEKLHLLNQNGFMYNKNTNFKENKGGFLQSSWVYISEKSVLDKDYEDLKDYIIQFSIKFNKNEVVIYNWHDNVKPKSARVFGYVYSEEEEEMMYAIKLNEYNKHIIVRESTLKKKKEDYNLEKGDKFIDENGTKHEILAKDRDKKRNDVVYFCRILDGKYKEQLITKLSYEIDYVLYN